MIELQNPLANRGDDDDKANRRQNQRTSIQRKFQ